MVNVSLVEAILREQEDPGALTTRKIREIYNNRSGEEAILQNSEIDKQFKSILIKTLEKCSATEKNDDDEPISYTVKLKDGDEGQTPNLKRRSIKLSKEKQNQSESDEGSSDSERNPGSSSVPNDKPFSPLFLNNMKKFGVSTDWLTKRSNSARHSSYSRSSVKSNTSQLDAMIKSASVKPIKSSRKLSFVETTENKPIELEFDKENLDPSEEKIEIVQQNKEKQNSISTAYELRSESDEEKQNSTLEKNSSTSKDFSLRFERVDLVKQKKKNRSSSSSSSSDREIDKKPSKTKRKSKKETKTVDEPTTKTKDKTERSKSRVEHLKKLLRVSGIRSVIRNNELDEFTTENEKIKYLESLFEKAGFNGNFNLKECEKFRKKREEQKELTEIQEKSTKVTGHVKAGRTLRGRARSPDDWTPSSVKRKRRIFDDEDEKDGKDEEDEGESSNEEKKSTNKRRRIRKAEASPEISENEME